MITHLNIPAGRRFGFDWTFHCEVDEDWNVVTATADADPNVTLRIVHSDEGWWIEATEWSHMDCVFDGPIVADPAGSPLAAMRQARLAWLYRLDFEERAIEARAEQLAAEGRL
jgi:hypothetical protein